MSGGGLFDKHARLATLPRMIIPRYWAESRLQHKTADKQVTVRRWGWSDESQEAAQAHADARAREALDRVLAGEALPDPRFDVTTTLCKIRDLFSRY